MQDNKMRWALRAVDRPVFVIGTMRSGTGFAGLRLNECDSLIGCPFELRRIWLYEGKVPIAADICGSCCPHLRANDSVHVPTQKLKKAFAYEVIKNVGQKPWTPGMRFLSKNPHLCNKIELVSSLLPNAQFVWTIRNMYDVVSSLKNLFEREEMGAKGVQHIWPDRTAQQCYRCFSVNRNALNNPLSGSHIFPGGNIVLLAEYWLESNMSILDFFDRHGDSKVSIVFHSLLLRQPNIISAQLRKFLQLPQKALSKMSQKVDISSIRAWNNPLTVAEIEELRAFELKYKPDIDRIFKAVHSIRA